MSTRTLLRLFGDQLQNRLQDATQNALPDSSSITSGQLVNCDVGTVPGNFPHKLGRKYLGYMVVKNGGITGVVDSPSTDDTKFIRLAAAVAGPITIWVF